MWTRACASVCVCMHVLRVCVCVCNLNCQAPEQSLNLFLLFLYCHRYWSGGAGKPHRVWRSSPPSAWFGLILSAGLNGAGREERSHGPVGMGVIGRGGADWCCTPARLSFFLSFLWVVFTKLICCSWANKSADLWSLVMSQNKTFGVAKQKKWSQISTLVPGCLCLQARMFVWQQISCPLVMMLMVCLTLCPSLLPLSLYVIWPLTPQVLRLMIQNWWSNWLSFFFLSSSVPLYRT